MPSRAFGKWYNCYMCVRKEMRAPARNDAYMNLSHGWKEKKEMKKIVAMILTVCMMGLCLVGCGAGVSFTADASLLENYANDNGGQYLDDTSSFSEYSQIDGVYVMLVDGVKVELWDLNDSDSAYQWFKENVQGLKDGGAVSSGAYTNESGDYSINSSDGRFYHILFCNDLGIYAFGDNADDVNKTLVALGIIK